MDELMTWIIVAAALSAVGGAVFWALIGWGVFKIASAATRQFEAQLRDAERLARGLSGGAAGSLPGPQQAQLLQMLAQMGNQMSQLNDLQRQRYDLRVGELQGMAAQAGITWTPPS